MRKIIRMDEEIHLELKKVLLEDIVELYKELDNPFAGGGLCYSLYRYDAYKMLLDLLEAAEDDYDE